jgi:hypothetical protein
VPCEAALATATDVGLPLVLTGMLLLLLSNATLVVMELATGAWNVKEALVAVPASVTTVIGTVPEPSGTVAVIELPLLTVKVAGVPPKLTALVP